MDGGSDQGWEDSLPDGASVIERLERLERMAQRYRDTVAAERGLETSVTNLGMTAESLATALVTVDHNQQMLSKLGVEIKEVTAKSATVEEKVEGAVKTAVNARRSVLTKIYGMAISFGLVAVVGVVGVTNYAENQDREEDRFKQITADICETRNRQAEILGTLIANNEKQILADSRMSPEDKKVQIERGRLFAKAFPHVDCTTLTEAN